MIRPVRMLIVAAGLAWAGCGVEPAPSASTATSELTPEAAAAPGSELAQAGAVPAELIQPQVANCGFECHTATADILELSWNACVHICPGGASGCTPMPPPPCP